MNLRRFLAIVSARNREFLRDRTALSWNIALPVLIVMGFAFAFTTDKPDIYKVGVYGDIEANIEVQNFIATEYLQIIPNKDLEAAIRKVERHQLDMLLDATVNRYWINDSSPNGYILERILVSAGSTIVKQSVSGSGVRYIDWLLPGVLGMNMMFSSLFGVGYVIVRYRKNGMLKRLRATPVTALEFLSAQIISRLWLILTVTAIVYIGTNFFVNFQMNGSYLNLFAIWAIGTVSMISLGLIVAARISSEEAANGLLNLLSWPMMLLSGIWFSLEGSHPLVQKLAMIFPLTHIIDAARSVMIDGAGLSGILGQIITLIVMSIVFLTVGALTFKWE